MKRSSTLFDFTFSGGGSKKKKEDGKELETTDSMEKQTSAREHRLRGVAEEVAVANEGRVWWGEEKTPWQRASENATY